MIEIKTLQQNVKGQTAFADKELSDALQDGWQIIHIGVIDNTSFDGGSGEAFPWRVVTLRRDKGLDNPLSPEAFAKRTQNAIRLDELDSLRVNLKYLFDNNASDKAFDDAWYAFNVACGNYVRDFILKGDVPEKRPQQATPISKPDTSDDNFAKVLAAWHSFDSASWDFMANDSLKNETSFMDTRAMFLTVFGDFVNHYSAETRIAKTPTENRFLQSSQSIDEHDTNRLLDANRLAVLRTFYGRVKDADAAFLAKTGDDTLEYAAMDQAINAYRTVAGNFVRDYILIENSDSKPQQAPRKAETLPATVEKAWTDAATCDADDWAMRLADLYDVIADFMDKRD